MREKVPKQEEMSRYVYELSNSNQPWFLGANVCKVLEIKNYSDGYSRLKPYEKTLTKTEGVDNPNTIYINESGLYRLVLTSRKPQAEAFQDWVVQEVLPSIRKTGLYNPLPFKLADDSKIVSFEADDYWVTSTTIAELFEKRHDNVLRDLESALEDLTNLLSIEEIKKFKLIDTTYIDDKQRVQVAKKVNRALFNYVVLAYKGDSAKIYRSRFILAFEELELQVKVFLTQQMIYNNPKRQQVYVLQNTATGMIKIGITNDINRRVAELQNASGCEIEVKYLAPKADNSKDIESIIHKELAAVRGIGEWFNISPNEVVELLTKQELVIETKQAAKLLGGLS